MSFLSNFEKICASRGIAPTRALRDAGLSASLYTKWKNAPLSVPNLETLDALASVLYVKIDEFAGRELCDYRTVDLKSFPELEELLNLCLTMPKAKREELLRFARFSAGGDRR